MHANLYVYNRGALSEPVMIMYLELGNIINSTLYIFGCKKKKKKIGRQPFLAMFRNNSQEILHFEHLIYLNFLSTKARREIHCVTNLGYIKMNTTICQMRQILSL